MHFGCECRAPGGLGSLMKGITYYFLGHAKGGTTLAWFFQRKNREWRVRLIRLAQSDFESALLDGSLVTEKEVHSLPPWLRRLEGKDIAMIDRERTKKIYKFKKTTNELSDDPQKQRSLRDIVDQRHSLICSLVKRSAEIFSAEDPITEIGRHARGCSPPQNGTRLTVWFVAYLVSGRNIWSLLPATMNNGQWDRSLKASTAKKSGRRPLYAGVMSGFSAVPLKDRIEAAYLRHAALGKPMTEIYLDSMTQDFKCKTMTDQDGIERLYHPKNLPFPTNRQFSYRILATFGLNAVQQAKYGQARMRQKSIASQGKFSERHANILEAVETDAQHLRERPRCLLLNEPAPPLIFARVVDATTARGVGLGASTAAESLETYKTAAFTCVVGGSLLGRIVGLPALNDENWPGAGLPPEWASDRGPGAAEELSCKFPLAQIPPSYEGQSKPTVETSHKKSTNLNGAPTYIASNLTTIELIRREFLHTLAQNESRDISDRLTPQMIARGVANNPNSLWNYLHSVGRTSAHPWPLEDAVRTFLRPVNFIRREDGLYLHFVRFDSDAMRETRMRNRLSLNQETSVRGYIFPLCTSIAWIETKDGLMEVEPMLALRDDKGQKYLSISEIELLADMLRTLKGKQRAHAVAVLAKAGIEFFDVSGKHWDSATRRRGAAPKASAAARIETDFLSRTQVRKAS